MSREQWRLKHEHYHPRVCRNCGNRKGLSACSACAIVRWNAKRAARRKRDNAAHGHKP